MMTPSLFLAVAVSASAEGVFVGTTPAGASVRQTLGVPANAEVEMMRWKLELQPGSRYRLDIDYGMTNPGHPGFKPASVRQLAQEGKFTVGDGGKSLRLAGGGPTAVIHFSRISGDVLYLMDSAGTLVNASREGWSYTLVRADRSEKSPDMNLIMNQPDMSYSIDPVSKGKDVYAVFEGRTPCQGIARELGLGKSINPGCHKAKWRLTLYQDPATSAPAGYKIEGTLFRRNARKGSWNFVTGDPAVLELSGDAPLYLRKASEDVLFLLARSRDWMIGNADFAYTLNRRVDLEDPLTLVGQALVDCPNAYGSASRDSRDDDPLLLTPAALFRWSLLGNGRRLLLLRGLRFIGCFP